MNLRRILHTVVLLLFDFLAFILSMTAGRFMALRVNGGVIHQSYQQLLSFGLVVLLFFGFNGLYTQNLGLWEEIRRLYRGLIAAFIVISLYLFTSGFQVNFISSYAGFCFFSALIAFPIERDLVQRLLYYTHLCKINTVIVGEKEDVQEVYRALKDEPHLCYNFVGFMIKNANPITQIEGLPVVKNIRALQYLVRSKDVDTVIIASPPNSHERISELYAEISRLIRNILVVPPLRGFAILNAKLEPLFFKNFLLIHHQNRLKDPISMTLKEVLDKLLGIALLPILLPVMLIIYIIIKLDSRGPAIYAHERIGKDGKVIKVFKFRTMYEDADKRLEEILQNNPEARKEWNTHFKLKNDPRVTRVGKFLRKTSLDELPQIFNILKGDMSFVGPRPVMREEIEEFYKDNAKYYTQVKPGITGLWQVSGRNKTDYPTRVFLDSWYVLNWSLWLDFMIVLKTFKVIILMEGAY